MRSLNLSQSDSGVDDLMTRIGGLSLESSKPPSRPPSIKKTENIDVLSILKKVEKDKVSGDRGKKYYSSKEMETFLRQIGAKTNGKKEELAQRLNEMLERYGL